MKNALLYFILIFQICKLNAQQLPEIPMKNGMVYYSFKHKLNNSKKCISKYYNTDFLVSLNRKIETFSSKINDEKPTLEQGVYTITFSQGFKNGSPHSQNNLNCKDTTVSKYNFIVFPISKKEKIADRKLTFNVETVFQDKNNYTLIFKGFILQESFLKGRSLVTNEIRLEDRYNELASKAELTKAEISFFEQLNYILVELDKLYGEVLEQQYLIDEQ